MSKDYTKSMLTTIRESISKAENKSMINESAQLEDADDKFEINNNTPQFGDVKKNQEKNIRKTIEEDIDITLVYYPSLKDLALNGKIESMRVAFQFRYKDSSGDGCYIWANELQLTETNARKIGKIRDAFYNWRKNLLEDDDLLDKLDKATKKK